MLASYWRARHPSLAGSDLDRIKICAKRMRVSKLREFLSNPKKPDFLLCSKQCGLLIEAMQKVAVWLAHWERTALPAPFVQDLLTLATKGIRLLVNFLNVIPSSCLTIAAFKMESREEFEEVFAGFLQALSSYVEVMRGSLSHANTHVNGLPVTMSLHNEICMRAVSLIAELKEDFRLLHIEAAEDRRALFECLERNFRLERNFGEDKEFRAAQLLLERLEQGNFSEDQESRAAQQLERLEQGNFREGEESRVAQLLMELLDNKQKQTKPLQLNSSDVMYDTLNRLGEGTYGVVYEATWMGMKVAVKQFHSQASLDGELNALRKTCHVNVMRAIAYHSEMGSRKSGLLMELMKGDLSQFVLRIRKAKSKLPLSVSIDILLQVATGMAYLHRMNIMHRDLKPENILFSRWPPMSTDELHEGPGDFTAKVTDFGDSRTHMYNTMRATARRGTACYRAPEILCAVDDIGRAWYSIK